MRFKKDRITIENSNQFACGEKMVNFDEAVSPNSLVIFADFITRRFDSVLRMTKKVVWFINEGNYKKCHKIQINERKKSFFFIFL